MEGRTISRPRTELDSLSRRRSLLCCIMAVRVSAVAQLHCTTSSHAEGTLRSLSNTYKMKTCPSPSTLPALKLPHPRIPAAPHSSPSSLPRSSLRHRHPILVLRCTPKIRRNRPPDCTIGSTCNPKHARNNGLNGPEAPPSRPRTKLQSTSKPNPEPPPGRSK